MPENVTFPPKRVEGETVAERLTENARERILPARYLRKDATGEVVETPAELFERVATYVAGAATEHGEQPGPWADRYESLLSELEFMPNSPTLMNAGTDLQQLAACFVISPEDDLESIFETVGDAARIFQSGGGVGYSFSRLRPKGDVVRETGGIASGPVSFMSVYDEMCETIKQGGRRRGAQMAILRVDHPDVGRFCVAKREEGRFSNFNISVAVTDAFYEAVRADEPYALHSPRSGEQYPVAEETARFYSPDYEDADEEAVESNLWRDHAGTIPGIDEFRDDLRLEAGDRMTLPARFVWRLLVDGAWRNGEPGLFVVDEANRDHSFDVDAHPGHRIRATNPCGEQPLEQFEACNLGHVNLSLLVVDGAPRWPEFESEGSLDERMAALLDSAIDWERLDRIVDWGMRFLDDVITVGEFPLAEIDEQVRGLRKVGLGVLGFADLLVQLGIRYGSAASIAAAGQLMAHVDHRAARASHELAAERGSFDAWEQSKYADPTAFPDWFRRHTGEDPEEWVSGYAIRNHGQTSVAPTGTTSMIADASAGCEPLYGVVYFKNVSEDVQGQEMLVEFDDYFLQVLAANGVDVEAVREEAADLLQSGAYEGPESLSIPEPLAEPFVTAFDVSIERHVDVQAAFQRHVDGAVSKTINAPADADRTAIGDAFERAIEADCKGLTVYRRGSREEQVLTTGSDE